MSARTRAIGLFLAQTNRSVFAHIERYRIFLCIERTELIHVRTHVSRHPKSRTHPTALAAEVEIARNDRHIGAASNVIKSRLPKFRARPRTLWWDAKRKGVALLKLLDHLIDNFTVYVPIDTDGTEPTEHRAEWVFDPRVLHHPLHRKSDALKERHEEQPIPVARMWHRQGDVFARRRELALELPTRETERKVHELVRFHTATLAKDESLWRVHFHGGGTHVSGGARDRASMEYTVRPIGFIRSPFVSKVEAPRQAVADGAVGVEGRIEMLPEYEHALDDLGGFDRLWVLFWFHEAKGAHAKVLPPRSTRKRGVFATRSPHRPNPIGMSAVKLTRVDGLTLYIRDLDLLDGTPVLDIKPYLAYADAFPDAKSGWVGTCDPRPSWSVTFTPAADEQLAWLTKAGLELALRQRIRDALSLGPHPHPYRRIKPLENGELVLAVKEWRVRFAKADDESSVVVKTVRTGFRPRELVTGTAPELALHRAFSERFG